MLYVVGHGDAFEEARDDLEYFRGPGSTLALPDESPASVLDLAGHFGARTLVITGTHGRWPEVLNAGGPDADCFRPLDLADPSTGEVPSSLETTHAYRIACP